MQAQKPLALALVCVLSVPAYAQAPEKVDLTALFKIKDEAFQRSKVMDHLFQLTDVNGPRLTGSPGYDKAGDWVIKQMKEYGAENVHKEKWGPFGRTWNFTRFSAHLIEPAYAPLIGFPLAWSKGTEGVVTGEPMLASLRLDSDLEKWKGKLKGKIVLIEPQRAIAPQTVPYSQRLSEKELNDTAMAPEPGASPFGARAANPALLNGRPDFLALRAFNRKRDKFLVDEGVLAVIGSGYRGDGGTVFGSNAGSREMKDAVPPTTIILTPEHYNRIYRLLDKKIAVKLELEVRAQIREEAMDSFNVIADLPGGKKKDEIVMVGAHLDSWHGGTGATDNAAGSSVAMEAMRILKKLDLKMDRTVRMALWSGEEQGLLGSKAYVKEHFADPTKMQLTQDHSKIAAYYNLDNGTGKIRGIHLQNNDMVRGVFDAYLAPVRDLGATTITIRNTGGTDHQSFDAVGIPGFQFVQDPVEYNTRTHHSNMDVYDYIQKGDMMQAAAVMAHFIYQTANRDEMLPRKPLPPPTPDRPEGGRRAENAPSGSQ